MNSSILVNRETRLLLLSALMMGVVAVGGLVMGIWSHSQAILLDGIFSLVAIVIKLLMMFTAMLTKQESSRRFQFGYWQCESFVMLMEGVFTLFIVAYALSVGIWGLLHGGREVEFGLAVYYAIFFSIGNWSFYAYVHQVNKKVKSYLVHYDNLSWLIDAVLATGLLISFSAAWMLQFTPYVYWQIYVDPLIMIVLGIQMVSPSLKILIPSVKQLLGIAPLELHQHVQQVMDGFLKKYGFQDYVSSVQVFGRAKIIEIDVLLPLDYPIQRVSDFDEIRGEIDAALGYRSYEKWVTITFTTTTKWMARDYDNDGVV